MKINTNHIEIFYEKSGCGQPVILIHGNGESHQIFDKLISQLSCHFTVYAVDSRNHGNSQKNLPVSYDLMAEDIISFINDLHIHKPIFYGFSDGGIVGLLIASRYPDLFSKLIISGANLNPAGLKSAVLIFFKIIYFFNRSLLIRMMLEEPQIDPQNLKNIMIPTLVLAGSKDVIKKEHTELIAKSIPGSKLEIIPGESHSSYIIHSDKLYKIIQPFLFNS